MRSAKLTDKQLAFIGEYMIDFNATKAAIRAGYSAKTANRIGPELLGKTCIAEEIKKRKAALQIKSGITVEAMLKMLTEDYEFGRERIVSDEGNEAARDPAFAMAAAEKIMKAIGGYEKDRRAAADLKLQITWGGDDDEG